MNPVWKSFKDAARGLKTVVREERNFKIEIALAALVVIAIFAADVSYTEAALLIFAVTIVITGEIVNTAIEDLCDKIEPNIDPAIGKIKDMMAAFVLVSSLGALAIGAIVFLHHVHLFT